MDKVSCVAGVREIGIVLTALFGILWLGESHGRQKLLGAVLMILAGPPSAWAAEVPEKAGKRCGGKPLSPPSRG